MMLQSTISIKVLRSDRPVFLSLTPRKGWGGRGMLGCVLNNFIVEQPLIHRTGVTSSRTLRRNHHILKPHMKDECRINRKSCTYLQRV